MVYTANWVTIYHLPPIKGTRNSYWRNEQPQQNPYDIPWNPDWFIGILIITINLIIPGHHITSYNSVVSHLPTETNSLPLKMGGWKMKTFRNWGNLGLFSGRNSMLYWRMVWLHILPEVSGHHLVKNQFAGNLGSGKVPTETPWTSRGWSWRIIHGSQALQILPAVASGLVDVDFLGTYEIRPNTKRQPTTA